MELEKIREYRLMMGMTQDELAERLEIPKRTLQNWESKTNIPPDYVINMVISKMFSFERFNDNGTVRLLSTYKFLLACITDFDGNIKPMFIPLYEKADGNMALFTKLLIESKEEDLIKTQAYAVASKKINPDGNHWKRVRAILGEKCAKTYSDCGGLKIGNDTFKSLISSNGGDGVTRYAVLEEGSFNTEMLDYVGVIEGSEINIYDYDCGNDIVQTLSGKYAIYRYCGIIVFCK